MHDTLFPLLARRTHVVHFLEEYIFFLRGIKVSAIFSAEKTYPKAGSQLQSREKKKKKIYGNSWARKRLRGGKKNLSMQFPKFG